MSLIELGEERNKYTSSYSFMIGINNDLKLKEKYTWEINGEGEFAAETKYGKIINFFDPLYSIDKEKFRFNKFQNISLSGLAYSLSKGDSITAIVWLTGFFS